MQRVAAIFNVFENYPDAHLGDFLAADSRFRRLCYNNQKLHQQYKRCYKDERIVHTLVQTL